MTAPVFARSAERIATDTGLGTTFVGAWLVGFATSTSARIPGRTIGKNWSGSSTPACARPEDENALDSAAAAGPLTRGHAA
jgi:hypothetical protein